MTFLFKYKMIPPTGFHIEPTNICTLKCSGCSRTRFIDQWPQHWKNYNLETADLLRFLDINLSGIGITFCGNYGDPIYHPKFIDMVVGVKEKGARVSIITNGSYKKPSWWQLLCSVLDEKDSITFSIDGSPDNFTIYRENADWPSINQAIETCATYPVRTIWKYIPFSFNQDDIEPTRKLSQDLGMDDFVLEPSDRFDEKTLHLIPANDLLGARKVSQDRFKKDQELEVDPKCFQGNQHFISASGHYSPCCYVADHRFYYKTQFGKNKSEYHIKQTTVSEILSRPTTINFYRSITEVAPKVCQYNCPKT